MKGFILIQNIIYRKSDIKNVSCWKFEYNEKEQIYKNCVYVELIDGKYKRLWYDTEEEAEKEFMWIYKELNE